MEDTSKRRGSKRAPNTALGRGRLVAGSRASVIWGIYLYARENPRPLFRVGERETDVEQHSTSTAKFSDRRSDGPQRGRCPRQLHGASGSGFGRPGGSERTGVLAGDNGCDTDFNRQDRSTPESGALEDRSGPAVGRTERGQRMVVR